MTMHATPAQFSAIQQYSSSSGTPITVAFGDGIGPEIMSACLRILLAGGAHLQFELIQIGESVYRSGNTAGIGSEAWDSLRRTKAFYKAPITTPQGGGYKSLNVTVRKSLGLYANVRPCRAYWPYVKAKHQDIDVVIVRENEEDLYAGIEHRQTQDVYQCLKLITRPGTEKIVRYAFKYARANGRKKVSCFSKDNIMKLTDGLFHQVFDEIGAEYPDIQKDHWIIDIGAAKLAVQPELFDVIVAPNLYGDIISDIAAEVTGSIGLAPSANIGVHGAMFEAVHGSAPSIAGTDVANPSGLLLAGISMLQHIGQPEPALRIHNAWLKTIEEGLHTPDVFDRDLSRKKVGTQAFADAVIDRLGQTPSMLSAPNYGPVHLQTETAGPAKVSEKKQLVGVDIFLDWRGDVAGLADSLMAAGNVPDFLTLIMITNRGVKVWPSGQPETFCVDHWRARFMASSGKPLDAASIADLFRRLAGAGLDVIKTECLFEFDGRPGFSLGQGQ